MEDGTTIIHLQDGASTIIDTADYHLVSNRRWCKDNEGYVSSSWPRPAVRMHAVILGTPKGTRTDHKDHDGLNNRRSNMRLASAAQNAANMETPQHNTSGFKGVSWHKSRGKWRAYAKKDRRQIYLGYFINLEDAARAYDTKAIELWGPFAKLNYPLT
jgi:hypothetical protein